MRLDHIAYRVANRNKTATFFVEAFGYKIANEFTIKFDNDESARCYALTPPEKQLEDLPWTNLKLVGIEGEKNKVERVARCEYHLAPEIFVSDGTDNSIIGKWVADRDGIGGIHHLAYQVDSVDRIMEVWRENGWADFSSEDSIKCPDLTQVFTVPHQLTGMTYEFIERGRDGFCKENVKSLMESTK